MSNTTAELLPNLPIVARAAASAVLVAIALLHVGWALGSAFPARSRASLSQHVIGVAPRGDLMPGRVATWVVAAGLLALAACVLALGVELGASAMSGLRAVALTFAVVFTLRGVGGFFEVSLRPAIRSTPYMKWSRFFYSPLSLLLALLIAVGAQG
jgi:hypothetical protein